MKHYPEICRKDECTGCSACINICPKACIKMIEDSYGHMYPSIDKSLCIECNLCRKVCPNNTTPLFQQVKHCYAAWAIDENDRQTSSSGGIASVLSKTIVNNNGIVYGCVADGFNIHHSRCNNIIDLAKFKGSKYVQSTIGNTYSQIKKDLKNNINVLFIGTPCQVAGLKTFLNKEYDNLFTIDLICHGVPSIKLLKEGIKELSISNLKFRDGHSNFFISYDKESEKIVRPLNTDYYLKSFFRGITYRESCYQCHYARPERVGDLSIGDFFDVGKLAPFPYNKKDGISVVLINNEKGKNLYNLTGKQIFSIERKYEEARLTNKQLSHPSTKTFRTTIFRYLYNKVGFKRAVFIALPDVMLKGYIKQILRINGN
jgi:coenzyme F420-reducing hydrogenase beta subunit